MLKPSLALILVVSITAALVISEKNRDIEKLTASNAELENSFRHKEMALKKEISELRNQITNLERSRKPITNVLPTVISTPGAQSVAEQKLSRPEWKAKVSLRRVEEHLALSSEERLRLEERLKDGQKLSVLSEIVGEERASKFFSDERKAAEAEEEEAIKEETFKLVRLLNLNSEQEAALTKILRSSRENLKEPLAKLKEQQDRAMELHSEPNGGEELRAVYEKYRTDLETINKRSDAYLVRELKGVLTEDQLNKLLEYQATEKQTLR